MIDGNSSIGSNSGTIYYCYSVFWTYPGDGRWFYTGPATEPDKLFTWQTTVPGLAGESISFPYWLPVFLVAISATAPWLRLRFSLRTLLIATTLVAVVLGWIIYATRH